MWSPEVLAEAVSVPYVLLVAYFIGCGLSIGNYVGYFRYNYENRYNSSLPRAYIAFVVIGTVVFVLFSSVMWMWAAKYSGSRSLKAQRLQWGIWAVFVAKDFPLFILELAAIMCCGWLNDYQGFVFIVQCIFTLFSFSFAWLSFTWRAAAVFQVYFGTFQDVTLKTGNEQVLIFATPEPMNAEAYHASQHVGVTWSGSRYASPPQNQQRYSPPSSPLGRYAAEPGSGTRSVGAFSYDPTPMHDNPPTPAHQLPVRRHPMPSPWDRRPVAPSPQRHAMLAYDTHYNGPSSPFGRSNSSVPQFDPSPRYGNASFNNI